ncbi:hypothetical protein F5884DRAFT_747068 [Xylogone sp. PMI_703]|nr:hypothetical protein F5884DRAFT_747068 [Xylogone sp. PMI_703]
MLLDKALHNMKLSDYCVGILLSISPTEVTFTQLGKFWHHDFTKDGAVLYNRVPRGYPFLSPDENVLKVPRRKSNGVKAHNQKVTLCGDTIDHPVSSHRLHEILTSDEYTWWQHFVFCGELTAHTSLPQSHPLFSSLPDLLRNYKAAYQSLPPVSDVREVESPSPASHVDVPTDTTRDGESSIQSLEAPVNDAGGAFSSMADSVDRKIAETVHAGMRDMNSPDSFSPFNDWLFDISIYKRHWNPFGFTDDCNYFRRGKKGRRGRRR